MGKVVYDYSVLDDIATKYQEAADKVTEIIGKYDSFSKAFVQEYDGYVMQEMFDTLDTTIKNHMTFLHDCLDVMNQYVKNSSETVENGDSDLSNAVDGGEK